MSRSEIVCLIELRPVIEIFLFYLGKALTLGNLMKACVPSASHYSLIGIGLDVNVSDLQPLPSMTTANLTTVFQRWIDSNKDVTWEKLLQVCDDFPNELGKTKADIQKFLSSP